MCKLGNRHVSQYLTNLGTKTYIVSLAQKLSVPKEDLVHIRTTGTNDNRGTWVHPRVATHLAQWISNDFAACVSGWVEEAKRTCPAVATEYNEEMGQLQADTGTHMEIEIKNRLAKELNGITEVQSVHGPIDIVTSQEVIEVKRANRYTHALGQVLGHSVQYPNMSKRIHLFGTSQELDDFCTKARDLYKRHSVKLSYEVVNI